MAADGGTWALIVSAGRGQRFGGTTPKQYLPLRGQAVLRHSVQRFMTHPRVDGVAVVIHPNDRDLYDGAVDGLGLAPPIYGGAERQDSVRLGLDGMAAAAPLNILIHDAVRPLVDGEVITTVIDGITDGVGVVPALPVSDTLKRAEDCRITETVPRAGLHRAQTPQGFRFADIRAAHGAAAGRDFTDDAAVAAAAGMTTVLVPGAEENLKITTADDLDRAAAVIGGAGMVRVGTGFDVHRFTAGSQVVICGLVIPHSHALEGHSDADVGLHAITDALLGAAGLGDIGDHFPPGDAEWQDAPSHIFLAHAGALIAARGGRVVNVDVTVICEAPKIAPHREAMRDRVAEILGIEPGRVNVKGKTTERLGFTGRGEGVAAQASAGVWLPNP